MPSWKIRRSLSVPDIGLSRVATAAISFDVGPLFDIGTGSSSLWEYKQVFGLKNVRRLKKEELNNNVVMFYYSTRSQNRFTFEPCIARGLVT